MTLHHPALTDIQVWKRIVPPFSLGAGQIPFVSNGNWTGSASFTANSQGSVVVRSVTSVTNAYHLSPDGPGLDMNQSCALAWSGTGNYFNTKDTVIWRSAAGVVAIGTGLGNSEGALVAKVLLTRMGTASGTFRPVVCPKVNVTPVGNVTTGEDSLMSYSFPGGAFSSALKGIRITAWGTISGSANAKTVKLKWGSTTILTYTWPISLATTWKIVAHVMSTGTDTQVYFAELTSIGAAAAATIDQETGTSAQDDGAAILIELTGEGVDTDDIIQTGLIVENFNP